MPLEGILSASGEGFIVPVGEPKCQWGILSASGWDSKCQWGDSKCQRGDPKCQ